MSPSINITFIIAKINNQKCSLTLYASPLVNHVVKGIPTIAHTLPTAHARKYHERNQELLGKETPIRNNQKQSSSR